MLNEEWEPFEKGVTEIRANQIRFNQGVGVVFFFFNNFFEFTVVGYKKRYVRICYYLYKNQFTIKNKYLHPKGIEKQI